MSIFWGSVHVRFSGAYTTPTEAWKNSLQKVSFPKKGKAGLWAAIFRYQVLWVSGREISKGRIPKSERFARKSESFNRIPPRFLLEGFRFGTRSWLFEERFRKSLGCFNLQLHWMEQPRICLVIHIGKTHSAHEPMQRREVSVLFCLPSREGIR